MEHTCSECLRHVEIFLRPATKITNYILMVPLEKHYLQGSEGTSKEKAYIARKMS